MPQLQKPPDQGRGLLKTVLDHPLEGIIVLLSLFAIVLGFMVGGLLLGLTLPGAGCFAIVGLCCTMVVLTMQSQDFLAMMPLRIEINLSANVQFAGGVS